MKEKILNYFKNDRTYQAGIKLYFEFGNRLSLKKQLNIQQESTYLKGVLFDELRQMAELTQKELDMIIASPVKNSVTPVQKTETKSADIPVPPKAQEPVKSGEKKAENKAPQKKKAPAKK